MIWTAHYNQQMNKAKWLSVRAYLSQSYNISRDAPIKLAGIVIGKVAEIDLKERKKVEVSLLLDKKYESYYLKNSTLETDSQIGLNTLLSGVSLNFIPGESNEHLKHNDVLEITEPQSISQVLNEWNIPQISQQVSIIVENLAQISSNINNNQQHIESLITNLRSSSESLLESSQMLPELMTGVNRVVVKIDQNIDNLEPQINSTLKNLDQVVGQSKTLILSATQLTQSMNSLMQLAPATLDASTSALYEIQALSRQVSNHWLLKDEDPATLLPSVNSIMLPSDSTLYESSQDPN